MTGYKTLRTRREKALSRIRMLCNSWSVSWVMVPLTRRSSDSLRWLWQPEDVQLLDLHIRSGMKLSESPAGHRRIQVNQARLKNLKVLVDTSTWRRRSPIWSLSRGSREAGLPDFESLGSHYGGIPIRNSYLYGGLLRTARTYSFGLDLSPNGAWTTVLLSCRRTMRHFRIYAVP